MRGRGLKRAQASVGCAHKRSHRAFVKSRIVSMKRYVARPFEPDQPCMRVYGAVEGLRFLRSRHFIHAAGE